MYLYLASSLNVELVFSILKGITKFGYVTLCDPELVQDKLSKLHKEVHNEDMTLTLFKIKIMNKQNWDQIKT